MYKVKTKKATIISLSIIFTTFLLLVYAVCKNSKPGNLHYLAANGRNITIDGNKSDISILTFNVWMPHVWLPENKKHERLIHLPDSLLKYNADIICLQEVFDLRARKTIIESFHNEYFFNRETLCKQKVWKVFSKDCFGGLLTLSKFPIVEEHFYEHLPFKGSNFAERLGKKGFLITTVMTPAGQINVINTHLYSGIKAKHQRYRLDQIKYIEKVCRERHVFNKPTFFVGDFNILHPQLCKSYSYDTTPFVYHYLIDSLQFTDAVDLIRDKELTYDPEKNKYANLWYNRSYGRQRFDYILFRIPNGYGIKTLNRKVIFNSGFLLSDHFGYYFTSSLIKNLPH